MGAALFKTATLVRHVITRTANSMLIPSETRQTASQALPIGSPRLSPDVATDVTGKHRELVTVRRERQSFGFSGPQSGHGGRQTDGRGMRSRRRRKFRLV